MKQSHLMIAPMLDWTDKHFRYFMRFITTKAWLYTEMITTGALLHADPHRFLAHDACESPIALQLGGFEPSALARCARLGENYGYDEINLNVGCPSSTVQAGRFGACLMKEPQTVATAIKAMQDAVSVPVSVKTRIGVDEFDSFDFFIAFIEALVDAGCTKFIIHARKAWLKGLSPKQNRTIPELKYDFVLALKERYPSLDISINGGFTELKDIMDYCQRLDGVMVGREAYHNPYKFAGIDQLLYGQCGANLSRIEVAQKMLPYVKRHCEEGGRLFAIVRHMLGLFYQVPGAKHWRRFLTEKARDKNAGVEVLEDAIVEMQAYL